MRAPAKSRHQLRIDLGDDIRPDYYDDGSSDELYVTGRQDTTRYHNTRLPAANG